MKLAIEKIKTDAGTQTRVNLNDDVITDYAAAMKEGIEFPAVDVFHDGSVYILADGFHRVMGAVRAGIKEIDANVKKGGILEAIVFALGSNRVHGLRRSNADKHNCIKIALASFPKATNRQIADMCGVHHSTVDEIDMQHKAAVGGNRQPERPADKVGRDGKTYKSRPVPTRKKEFLKDSNGTTLPSQLETLFKRGSEIDAMVGELSRIKCELKTMNDNKDPLIHGINYQDVLAKIESVYFSLKNGKPEYVCPYCQGVNTQGCRPCGETGLVGKYFWDTCAAKEFKRRQQ